MKASPNLIAALLRTADRIENDPTYDWYVSNRCSCGILAEELGVKAPAYLGSWKSRAQDVMCAATHMPMFRQLQQHGLELEDFARLETPPCLVQDSKISRNTPETRKAAANYFRQVANDLQLQLRQLNPQSRPLPTTTTAPSVVAVVGWPVTTPVTEEAPV